MGSVKGLDIGMRAMTASMTAIKTAGQNIANVNVPGYSRRVIDTKSVSYGGEDAVTVLQIRRIRDRFTDHHIRMESQSLGKWEMQSLFYGQMEGIFLEPSEHGLNNTISEFWNSWEDLASVPFDSAPRSVVVQQGIVLAQSINQLDSQFIDLRRTADGYVKDRVSKVNDLADMIADLNVRIIATEASDLEASDARDSRDLLVDEMSKMVNTTIIEREGGAISVLIGGRAIVDDATVAHLGTVLTVSDDMRVSNVVWESDGAAASITGGEIAGLIKMRDEAIPGVTAEMDIMAITLIDEVNTIHASGFGSNDATGLDFFTGTSASDIAVNNVIVNDIANVAAAGNIEEPGGNSIARAIADLATSNSAGSLLFGVGLGYQVDLDTDTISPGLRQEFVDAGATLSPANVTVSIIEADNRWLIDDPDSNKRYYVRKEDGVLNIYPASISIGSFYSNSVNSLGAHAQSASMMRENSEILLIGLEEQRESMSGVSLDEEAANLIKFQHAYESAAQYISVISELMDTLMQIAS